MWWLQLSNITLKFMELDNKGPKAGDKNVEIHLGNKMVTER